MCNDKGLKRIYNIQHHYFPIIILLLLFCMRHTIIYSWMTVIGNPLFGKLKTRHLMTFFLYFSYLFL